MPRVELKAEVCLLEQMRATRTVFGVEEVQQICDGAVAEDQEQCCCAGEVPCSVVNIFGRTRRCRSCGLVTSRYATVARACLLIKVACEQMNDGRFQTTR